MSAKTTRAPAGLASAGRAVWRKIVTDLGDDWELDGRELLVLEAACRQADLNAELEEALAREGVSVADAQGQQRLNATVTELRQGRIAFERLLGSLALPSDGAPMTAGQRRAQAAASARWLREGKRGRRRGAA